MTLYFVLNLNNSGNARRDVNKINVKVSMEESQIVLDIETGEA